MPSSKPSERPVVDAKPFWSILAQKGALKVVTSQKVSEFAVSEHTLQAPARANSRLERPERLDPL